MQSATSSKSLYFLFALIVLLWGFSWPASKLGVAYMPPIWFAAGRLAIGTICMFAFLLASGKFVVPKRKDLPLIITIGILQMGLFMALMSVGLYYSGAGRAAIIVYSTPLWVVPIAILFFGEQVRPLKLIGLLLGLVGMFTLLNPWQLDWHNKNLILGNALLLLASISWAGAMLIARYATWHNSALALIPWQLLVGTIPVILVALYFEPHPHIEWHWDLLAIMFYIGVLVTAVGYWGTMLISKSLPVVTTSLCFLATPIIGLLSSAWFLHEPISSDLIIAMTLIILGLVCVALSGRRKIKK